MSISYKSKNNDINYLSGHLHCSDNDNKLSFFSLFLSTGYGMEILYFQIDSFVKSCDVQLES